MDQIIKTYKLRHPVKDGDDTIAELKFRAATMKDLLELPVNAGTWKFEHLVPIAVRLCGEMSHVIEKLHPSDAMEVVGFLGEHLLGDSPATGEQSSAT